MWQAGSDETHEFLILVLIRSMQFTWSAHRIADTLYVDFSSAGGWSWTWFSGARSGFLGCGSSVGR